MTTEKSSGISGRRFLMTVVGIGLTLLVLSASDVLAQSRAEGQGGGGGLTGEEQYQRAKAIGWVNSEGTPMVIQQASAREISQAQFSQLTGKRSQCSRMSTFPEMSVMNVSGKVITSAIFLAESKFGDKHVIIVKNLSLASGGTYTVSSSRWLLPEKVTAQQEDGTYKSGLKKPGPDSEKYWLAGGASDVRVTVARVIFDDGSEWRFPEGFHFDNHGEVAR